MPDSDIESSVVASLNLYPNLHFGGWDCMVFVQAKPQALFSSKDFRPACGNDFKKNIVFG